MKISEDKLTIPKSREERIKRLDNSLKTLKSEFIGLNDIIDEIGKSVSSWYVTPEIIERPVVISLWGMTGTGKTCVIRRLVELLGLLGKTLFFDCGQESKNENSDITSKMSDLLENSEDTTDLDASDYVFVLDEFQFARTINESGCEETSASNRVIWKLIDNGILELYNYNYGFMNYIHIVNEWSIFINESVDFYNIPIKEGKIIDKKYIELIKLNSGIETVVDLPTTEDGDSIKPLNIINYRILQSLVSISRLLVDSSVSNILLKLKSYTKLGDLISELFSYIKYISKPKIIDCSKSLVFLIGNLDEAYRCSGDLNPDIDADMFHNLTSKVSISDIKVALKKRFRAEQISRMGNNMIKYPTLNKKSFIELINKETSRMFTKFYNTTNIKVEFGQDIIELLYSEGVFPTQGTRPIFTTINSIISPLLSEIIINNGNNQKPVIIKIKNEEDWKLKKFRLDNTIVSVIIDDKIIDKVIPLELGKLRNPKNKKCRYITSVHESGHAIVYSYLYGRLPIEIVSVSVDSGGFCNIYDKDEKESINSKSDVDNYIMTGLAGYLSERLIYKNNPDKCLMGSSSDIERVWTEFSDNVYVNGYFSPIKISDKMYCHTAISSGISDDIILPGDDKSIKNKCKERFYELVGKTKEILEKETVLIKKMSIYLGENGHMDSETFLDFIKKYGNILTPEFMEKTRKLEEDYYYSKLIEE